MYPILLLLLSILASSQVLAKHPNILFIFADDLGYEQLGCYANLKNKTPHLDRMAKEGTRFARAYTSPVCTPSRMSVYTGMYTPRHGYTGVLPVHLGTRKAVDFAKKFPTYAQLLRKAGYMTSVTGKWQLATLQYHPNHIRSAGFDSWCVWQIWLNGKKTTRYWYPTLNLDGQVWRKAKSEFGPDMLTEYVIQRMKEAQAQKKPFLIHHNMMLPHVPIVDTPTNRQDGTKRSLASMIEYMDSQVGMLIEAVDAMGIADNTYIFFVGDNGTDGGDKIISAGKVIGGKRALTDGGIHVPMLARCPGKVPAGMVAQDLIDSVDFFPTFCDLAEVEVPKGQAPDGLSFKSVLHGCGPGKREWITAGISNNFLVFDGEWRLDYQKKTLIDCRNLPEETPADLNLPEAKEAKVKLEKILLQLKAMRN